MQPFSPSHEGEWKRLALVPSFGTVGESPRETYMPNIASMLKEEIARISRKELRRLVDPLKKQLIAQRHDIAALKRERDSLKREIATLAKSAKGVVASASGPSAEARPRFSPVGLRSLRKRLGLSADDLGRIVGVSGQSVYNWELEKTRPRHAQLERIAELRGIGKREAHNMLTARRKTKAKAGSA